MKKIILTIVATSVLVGCGKKEKKKITAQEVKKQEVVHEVLDGKKLLEVKCFLCHNPVVSQDEMVAPPMVAIKAMYLKEGTTRKSFIKDFVAFSIKPNVENSKMKHAVEKFNLMPNQAFDEKEITEIAQYVYDFKIAEPVWFKNHWKEKHGTLYNNSGKKTELIEKEKTLAEIGLSYALGTKKVLGKNLMGTIQKKGTLDALKFCNHKAYPLTDSMSVAFNVSIKRVSDKPRNPNNKANDKELAIIEGYKKILAGKGQLKSVVEEKDGSVQFYHPIKTNNMCLQCHGTPNKQIKLTTLARIKELYTKDKAQGYKANQIRGIWSINFKK